jgi:hypothetical protein
MFLTRHRTARATGDASDASDAKERCRRCGQRIEVDPDLSTSVFEGMHWLCFHLDYEHSTDPDLPCADFAGCPWWTIRYYENTFVR